MTLSEGTTIAYTGAQIKPTVSSVVLKGNTLRSDDDYNKTIRYGTNKDAGSTGYVYVDAKSGSNYTGTATGTFKITGAASNSIAGATITINGVKDGEEAKYAYTGNPITPAVTVKMGKTVLKTSDYDVEYADNVAVGTATIIVKGKGNYSPATSVTKNFTIKANEITSASIQAISAQEYTGSAIEPTVVVKVNGKTVNPSFYDVTYRNNTNVGTNTAVVTVTAKDGNNRYTGRGEKTFSITAHKITEDDVEISSEATYTSSNVRPASIKVYKNSTSDDLLSENVAYTVTCSNNVNVGRATCVIKAIGPNYTGTVTKYYQIVNGKGDIDIGNAVIRDISDQTYTGSEINPGVSVTLNGKSFSSYDVKYFNNVNAGQATVYIYGKGKYTGSARKIFLIKPAAISGASVASIPAQKYTGSPVEVHPNVTYRGKTLAEGGDYTVSCSNNVNIGTATVTLYGTGNFTGSVSRTFSISEKVDEKKVYATDFSLGETYEITSGGSVSINPSLTPSDANTYQIRWNSQNSAFTLSSGADTGKTAMTTQDTGITVSTKATSGSGVVSATLYGENNKEIKTLYVFIKVTKQFSDVSTSTYYSTAVDALANYGYTTGSGASREFHATPVVNGNTTTTYNPAGPVTRGQFVTMMYNKALADYKAGKSTTDPSKAAASGFSDVGSSAYYASAVNWASANGIAQGTSASTFNPNGTVTRAEAVTFLQRWLGGSSVASTQFSDVASSSYYSGAVGWAVKNGVTNGTSATTFEPGTKCNRGQAATFIYRAAF